MKTLRIQSLWLAVLLIALITSSAHGQVTPSADSYTNTADSTTNYGAQTLLDVDGAAQVTYIQFPLSSIPTGASISQATLKLYINSVTKAGSFNVDYVNAAWSESTIDSSNAPPLGTTIASNVDVTTADKNQYILINVTSAVQAWLNGSETNNGIALVANSTFDATFDSKENTTTSHPAELDIAYAGGDGTITGVTTASSSGLTGGGTSGALNLSLTTACSSGQVLSWSGSAWVCAALKGAGTITGVTAGTDLIGGGGSGKVTLNVDTTKVPQLSAANTFTGNQTVSGNLSATGIVSGSSFEIGSNLFAFGSSANSNAFLGFAGNTTATGQFNTATGWAALENNTTGQFNAATGGAALLSNTTGSFNTASGPQALSRNTTASYNTATGYAALYFNTTGPYNTATGYQALSSNTTANYNTATGAEALYNTTGEANLADGALALYSNTSGAGNTAVGADACYSNTTSNYVTCVGYSSTASDAISNATAIGARARVEQSNSLVLGGTGDSAVNVGIGTTKPSNILTVARGAGHPVSDSWETYSSRRWKTNIQTLPNALGKVEHLRGVSYDLKDSGKHEIGVIAEEVGKVIPEVVSYEQNGKDAAGVDYSRLTAVLIEAVKQQQREISALKRQLQTRAAKQAALESRIEHLERDRDAQLASAHPNR
jgi:hypothetical protein